MKTCDVPKKLHDARHRHVERWNPNNDSLYALSHSQESNKGGTKFRFGVFMGLKKYKIGTTKNFERIVHWRSIIKTLKRRNITKNRGRKTFDDIDSS